ncbi:MAG: TIGR03089 family protein [Actinomycetales bacterium]
MPRAADTPAGLLAGLSSSDPTRPRLTWYDEAPGPTQGERIELSGRVLTNWVAKAANLLRDELDIGPGSLVAVDLPGHWRTAYWLLASWSVGARVETGLCQSRPDAVVTDDPEAWPGSPVVAVSLPALVRGWAGPPLPSGAIDEARDLATYPDAFVVADEPAPDAAALTTRSGTWTFADLMRQARAAGLEPHARVLSTAGPEDAVTSWLAAWAVDGSLVLVRQAPAGADDARLRQIAETERVTGYQRL